MVSKNRENSNKEVVEFSALEQQVLEMEREEKKRREEEVQENLIFKILKTKFQKI